MKIETQRRFPLTRVVLGATVFVFGVLLSEHLNMLLGIVFVLLGMVIGAPRYRGLILQTLFLVLYLSTSWIGYFYAVESGESGPTLGEWLSDRWWFVVLIATIFLGPFLARYRNNADAWRTLKESYSSDLDSIGARETYPTISGRLVVDTEYFDADVVTSELGIFITRDDGGHVCLPWHRLQRIVFEGSKPRRTKVDLSRNLMNPLVLDLPWHEDMTKEIPQHVKVETFA